MLIIKEREKKIIKYTLVTVIALLFVFGVQTKSALSEDSKQGISSSDIPVMYIYKHCNKEVVYIVSIKDKVYVIHNNSQYRDVINKLKDVSSQRVFKIEEMSNINCPTFI